MTRRRWILLLLACLPAATVTPARGQGMAGMPPAQVVVTELVRGEVPPQETFVGTVYYQEVSNVASEVSGIVEQVRIEDGQRVREGDVFVTLNADLIRKRTAAARAGHEQVLAELEKARRDLERFENLYRQESVAEQAYDENRFRVLALEKRALALEAEVEGLETEIRKKTIRAPLAGVVLERLVDRGEWVSPGQSVAVVARDDAPEVVVDVPERVIRHVEVGAVVEVQAGGRSHEGRVFALIPRGDVATRTFPLKIRLAGGRGLMEGMQASVTLPTGDVAPAFIAPRDALVSPLGVTTVFAVADGQARAVPVQVLGYRGDRVGIEGPGLAEGTRVVVKGNERLRDGQPVSVEGAAQSAPR